MAYRILDDLSANLQEGNTSTDNTERITLQSDGQDRVDLPDSSYVRDAQITRDGTDLVLETADGTVVIEGYYAAEPMPNLVAPDGITLTPDLVNSFTHGGNEYANAGSANMMDVSPVGAVQEFSGQATVTRLDGSVETISIGTPIFQGDVIDTDDDGAVNIAFIDETTFAVSEDARLAIDEYVFDPATESGTSNFSVLKGVFVFTSGLIGRDDPDDVMIDTPSGSIGIRGTIIAGNVTTGEITVIEGAIVLHDFAGNSITLANQYETAKFNTSGGTIDHMGEMNAHDVASKFASVSTVSPDLFSSIQDSASETGQDNRNTPTQSTQENQNTEETLEQQDSTGEQETINNETLNAEESISEEGETEAQDDGDSGDSGDTGEGGIEQTTTSEGQEEASGESETPLEAPMEEIIMSGDIIESDIQSSSSTTTIDTTIDAGENLEPALPPPPPPETQNTETEETTVEPENTKPPFEIEVTKLAFAENTAGANMLHIQGNFTGYTNINLLGLSQNYYDVVRIDDNNLTIKLKNGVSMDAENPGNVRLVATNGNGSESIVQNISVDILNIDEPTIYTAASPNISMVDNVFSGSADSIFTYDFSQEFFDPEGGITGYTITTLPGAGSGIDSSNFNTNTGILTINFSNTVADSTFNFTVTALSSNPVDASHNFTFDLYNADIGTGTSVITTFGKVYSGTDSSIFINANNVSVFLDQNTSANTVTINSNNSYVKAGGGNDTIDITSSAISGYHIYGDDGNDIINMNSVNGKAYGGEGDDSFHLLNSGTVSTLHSASTGVKIDGGSGNDLLHLGTGDAIDFRNITPGLIKNIEKIAFINGQSNQIKLGYDDVINMTDEDNVLKIDMDANDTLEFHNNSGRNFFKTGQTGNGTDQYDVYTDGTITLLVDTTHAEVSGIL